MKLRFLIACLLTTAALAQSPDSSGAPGTMITTQTTLVLAPVLVRTKAGAPVFTLKASDFKVTDDGVEQQATVDEDTGAEPLALVIAIETGGEGAHQLGKYGNLGTLIEAVVGNVPHLVAVVEFDSQARVALDFTANLETVGRAIPGLEQGDKGAATLDALRYCVGMLRRQPATYRRAILLISETIDRTSHTSMEDALRVTSDTNTAIYSVAFPSPRTETKNGTFQLTEPDTPGPAKGCMSRDPKDPPDEGRLEQAFDCLGLLAPPLRLAKMAAIASMNSMRQNVPETAAELTGGEYFAFKNARSMERDMLSISHHLPNRYVLSFHPQSPHPGFHAIGLRLTDGHDLVITGRKGYWVENEPAPTQLP